MIFRSDIYPGQQLRVLVDQPWGAVCDVGEIVTVQDSDRNRHPMVDDFPDFIIETPSGGTWFFSFDVLGEFEIIQDHSDEFKASEEVEYLEAFDALHDSVVYDPLPIEISSAKEFGAALAAVMSRQQVDPELVEVSDRGVSDDSALRKQSPMFSGAIAYFPDALYEVAEHSWVSNEKHNPGQPLHWSRDKSDDHLECLQRHMTDLAKALARGDEAEVAYHHKAISWRALAAHQINIEEAQA
jgi:hypothetical protein